ncbi:MAG: GNAT family N-acetyltransferase [Opitutaceae bacterium]|nr:GNAT family N-acetyltransferase [Opitutaceae bacterium]
MGQPVGVPVLNWQPRPAPPREALVGRYCRLEPIDPSRHADDVYAALAEAADDATWTYLPYGPFESAAAFRTWMERTCLGDDPLFFAILDATSGRAVGLAAYLRIDRTNGVIEVGHLVYSPRLQRTRAATEAMVLMMRRAFELGYRRYEWKCNSLNHPSRAAAERLGFAFEGIFRQAVVVKGRNRDTAWYSIIDAEWPALRTAFERWLAPDNFEASGRQRIRLSELTGTLRQPQA